MLIEHRSLHFSGDWFGDLGRGSMLIEHCSLHFFWSCNAPDFSQVNIKSQSGLNIDGEGYSRGMVRFTVYL